MSLEEKDLKIKQGMYSDALNDLDELSDDTSIETAILRIKALTFQGIMSLLPWKKQN